MISKLSSHQRILSVSSTVHVIDSISLFSCCNSLNPCRTHYDSRTFLQLFIVCSYTIASRNSLFIGSRVVNEGKLINILSFTRRPFKHQSERTCLWTDSTRFIREVPAVMTSMSFPQLRFIHVFLNHLTHLKINVSIFIHVECSEDVIAKLFGVPGWEEHLVHIYEFCWR